MICGSGGSKSRLAKAAGAEPAGQMRHEKVHAVVARSTFPSQNGQNTRGADHFWKLRCRKNARRCGAKHISKWKCTKHTILGALLEVEMQISPVEGYRTSSRGGCFFFNKGGGGLLQGRGGLLQGGGGFFFNKGGGGTSSRGGGASSLRRGGASGGSSSSSGGSSSSSGGGGGRGAGRGGRMRRRRCIKKSGWAPSPRKAFHVPGQEEMDTERSRERERERKEEAPPPSRRSPLPFKKPPPPFFFLGGAAPHWRLPFKEALPWRSHPPLEEGGTPTLSGRSLEMSKKCTPLWREAHFQVNMYKTHHVRTTFGGSDVEKVSKKCTPLWREAHFEVKSVKNWGFWAFFDVKMSKK